MTVAPAARRKAESNGKHEPQTPALPEDEAGMTRPVPIARIIKSPTNPRRHFDQAKLEELAVSIRAKGVLQPILVRPAKNWSIEPGKQGGKPGYFVVNHVHTLIDGESFETTEAAAKARAPRYELVAGERRLRAAQMAGLESIPAVVRDLSDREALEVQVIENEQREDIPALEKAEGYAALIRAGATVERLADQIGKSVSTIRGLLKLQELPAIAREAVLKGMLPSHTAQLVARVPGQQERATVAVRVITDDRHDGKPDKRDGMGRANAIARDAIERGETPMPYRDAKELIQREFMVELKGAPFSRQDANLLPLVPSCEGCPLRVGNLQKIDPEGYAGVRGDVCTDPGCYRKKVEAHQKQVVSKEEAKGQRVMEQKLANKVFLEFSADGETRHDGDWVNLAKKCYQDKKQRTYAELIGKDLEAKHQTFVAFDQGGRKWTLAPKLHVAELLKAKHKISASLGGKSKSSGSSADYQTQYRRDEEKRQREREERIEVARRCLPTIAEKAAKIVTEKLAPEGLRANSPALKLLRIIVLEAIGGGGIDDARRLVGVRRGLKPKKLTWGGENWTEPVRDLAGELDVADLLSLGAEVLAADDLCGFNRTASDPLLALAGIDVGAIEAKVKKELAAQRKAAKAVGNGKPVGDDQADEDLDEEGGDE
jgi:ParB/RepB/Spo0J family partition protein